MNPNYDTFINQVYVNRPLHTLIPRHCYKGSYHDTFYFSWSSTDYPEKDLKLFDVNGLYSYVAMKNKFMIGSYNILIGAGLKDLHLVNDKFIYNGVHVMGSMMVSILAPSDLMYPFLSYKAKNGSLFNTLCSSCCETKSFKLCSHSEKERAIMGSFMISEIEYSLKLGYKLLAIFECHVYTKQDYVFKDFVEKLTFCKTRASNCFANLKGTDDKQKYCDQLNQKMDFNGLLLTPNNIKANCGKRFFYKLAQNSFFGKF